MQPIFFTFNLMCLVAFAWKVHPDFPLLLSANRDEFFQRPTQPLHLWKEGFYGGKDLQAGGTWMGFHPNGKWALLTNFRDFHQKKQAKISRGKLVSDFLSSTLSPENYLDKIQEKSIEFDGFNLLVSDGNSLFYYSNYGKGPTELHAGIHGLSNGLLNDPWPKTELAKKQIQETLHEPIDGPKDGPKDEQLLSILKSGEKYPEELLPKTGVSREMEIDLSAQLIRIPPGYGTVSASAVLRNKQGSTLIRERSFAWETVNFRDTVIQF
jgi:uncharacterized protein with NRDE domain